MGSSYLIGTACMGIRIAAAPAGPRNDNVVLMLQGRPMGTRGFRSAYTRAADSRPYNLESKHTVGRGLAPAASGDFGACTHLSVSRCYWASVQHSSSCAGSASPRNRLFR